MAAIDKGVTDVLCKPTLFMRLFRYIAYQTLEYPKSFSKFAIGVTGKPLHPTFTNQHLTCILLG